MDESIRLLGLDFSLASPELIEVLLEDCPDDAVFAEIAAANKKRPEVLRLLLENPDTPDEVKRTITALVPATAGVPGTLGRTERAGGGRSENLARKIQKLTVSDRVHLAMKGGREIRGILVRDPNKEVMLGVLENAKVTESEVEMIAKSRTTLEEALRRIAKNREWMKKYPILYGLVTNPKTPPGVAVPYISGIKTKDLLVIEKNRNVPEAVRIAAKKLMLWRKPR